jgi:hypothetical protein
MEIEIYPATQTRVLKDPLSAFDGSDTTKWLSFGRAFSGLIVTPSGGASIVQSLSFTTGGDAPERDPIAYQLFGTNDGITSVDNSTGLAENWTLMWWRLNGIELIHTTGACTQHDRPFVNPQQLRGGTLRTNLFSRLFAPRTRMPLIP